MRNSRPSSPWTYLALTLSWSWLFYLAAAALGEPFSTLPTQVLFAIGGLGPAIAGISLTYLTRGPAGRRDYWRRVVDFRRIGPQWLAVIFLLFPLTGALAIATGMLSGESLPALDNVAGYLAEPWRLIPFAVFLLFFGPLPEELGWRGYGLDRLQEHHSALTSSLILGAVWGLWHLPLYLIEGYPLRQVFPLGTLRFWLDFVVGAVFAEAVLLTWIFNNTNRSTLSAILFHFMGNFTGEFLELPDPFRQYQTLWFVAITFAVIFVWGARTLTRGQMDLPPVQKSPAP